MAQRGAETRDDVMQAQDLQRMLFERTAAEFMSRWERKHPRPAFGGIVLTLILAILFAIFGMGALAAVFFVITGLQGAYAVWIQVVRSSTQAMEVQAEIQKGNLPPESADIVHSRLRWWNHLIVPHNWARHSRIHERKFQLEAKVKELHHNKQTLLDEESENAEQLEALPDPDILGLAGQINNLAQRIEYEQAIARIQDELPRIHEEMVLYQALLLKVRQVTDRLDEIDRSIETFPSPRGGSLQDYIQNALQVLETRRSMVRWVDRIIPGDFLELVQVRSFIGDKDEGDSKRASERRTAKPKEAENGASETPSKSASSAEIPAPEKPFSKWRNDPDSPPPNPSEYVR